MASTDKKIQLLINACDKLTQTSLIQAGNFLAVVFDNNENPRTYYNCKIPILVIVKNSPNDVFFTSE